MWPGGLLAVSRKPREQQSVQFETAGMSLWSRKHCRAEPCVGKSMFGCVYADPDSPPYWRPRCVAGCEMKNAGLT